MNERERLVRAAAEEPSDDAPRLVLADWLEEHGEAERAAFLRTGVELARLDEADERYPEVAARYYRSATFAVSPSEPWFDHVPDGVAYFLRGMIGGAVVTPKEYLRHKAPKWARLPLEELVLTESQGPEEGRAVARRGELSRLRLLGLGAWGPAAARPLLCGCEPLKGLRELTLYLGRWELEGDSPSSLGELAEAIDLPALEALAWHESDVLSWPTLVPAFGRLSRLVLMSGSGAELDEGADSYGWLVGTPLWKGLRQANLWHDINTIGYSTVYQTDPLPDFGRNFRAAPLEDFRLAMDDIPRLAALRSWGALHTLRIGVNALDDLLAPLARSPRARQLRRLFLDYPDGPYPPEGQPMPEVLAGPHLAGLRHLRYEPYAFGEGELAGLRDAAFREGLLRLDLGRYGEALSADHLGELLARPWLALRYLQVRPTTEGALAPLLTTPNLPSLCTLVVHGWSDFGEAAVTSLARAPGLPHLCLVVANEVEWLLRGGEARKVSPTVWLAPRDTFMQWPFR
jgi:uncharacterized protein (TIGR02996 family)